MQWWVPSHSHSPGILNSLRKFVLISRTVEDHLGDSAPANYPFLGYFITKTPLVSLHDIFEINISDILGGGRYSLHMFSAGEEDVLCCVYLQV